MVDDEHGRPVRPRVPRGDELAVLNGGAGGTAAARYAELGWPVVPVAAMAGGQCGCRLHGDCTHPAKHPLTPGGIKAGTTDQAQVAEWWDYWPTAGVGILTGSKSGLVVVDVDPAHGGRDSLRALKGDGAGLPRTLYARTGGGGFHLLYAAPATVVGNAVGRLGRRELAGIDVRGENGYVVASPSGHRSGGRYGWAATPDTVAPLPAWITERPDVARAAEVPRLTRGDRRAAYAAQALVGECDRVADAPEGQRNATLNRSAFSLGTLVGAGVLDEGVAVAALAAAATTASHGGARPMREREVMATIRSGMSEGIRRPRTVGGAGGSTAPTTGAHGPVPRPGRDTGFGRSSLRP